MKQRAGPINYPSVTNERDGNTLGRSSPVVRLAVVYPLGADLPHYPQRGNAMGYMENLNRLMAVSVDVLNPLRQQYPSVSFNANVSDYSTTVGIFIYAGEGHDPVEALKAVRKAVGTVEKKQGYSGLYLKQSTKYDDGSRVEYTIYPASGTCEKIKTGTKTVEKPDPTVEVPLVEVEEDVYEWECKGVNL